MCAMGLLGTRSGLPTGMFRIHPPHCLPDMRERGKVDAEPFLQCPWFQPREISYGDIIRSLANHPASPDNFSQ